MKLKPFQIGPVRVEFPVVLAALAGYSDLAYRLICRRLGAAYCATEMILDRCLLHAPKLQRRLARLADDDHPVAGQLIGREPETMAEAARVLCRLGFDVVDLNFACPVRKALARRRGGYLMREPALAGEIVGAVVAAADRPVTVKLRQRFDLRDGEEAFWRIAEAAVDAGAAGLCVHARSIKIKYVGPADWDFLARVKRRFPDRVIVGSGDVFRPPDALRMIEQTGVDAAAVARGALGNPWFFRAARALAAGRPAPAPTLAEQRDVIRRHFDAAVELYGPVRGPKIMRKFGIRYARVHPTPRRVRMAFAAVRQPAEWHAVLDEFYGGARG